MMAISFTVIAMPDSKRLETFSRQVPQGLVDVFYAREIDEAFAAFDVEKFERTYGRAPRNGEVGCTHSHFELQKNVSTDWLCILEDDAVLSDDFFDVVNQIATQSLPPTVVVLGQSRTLSRNDWFTQLKQPITRRFWLAHDLYAGEKSYINKFGTVGYMINWAASEAIREETIKPYWQADDWRLLSHTYGLKILHLNRLVVHEDLHSYETTTGNGLGLRNDIHSRPFFEISGMLVRRLQQLLGTL